MLALKYSIRSEALHIVDENRLNMYKNTHQFDECTISFSCWLSFAVEHNPPLWCWRHSRSYEFIAQQHDTNFEISQSKIWGFAAVQSEMIALCDVRGIRYCKDLPPDKHAVDPGISQSRIQGITARQSNKHSSVMFKAVIVNRQCGFVTEQRIVDSEIDQSKRQSNAKAYRQQCSLSPTKFPSVANVYTAGAELLSKAQPFRNSCFDLERVIHSIYW